MTARESARDGRIDPRFDADGATLRVFDPIERRRCELLADADVALAPAETGRFRFPVDSAVAFEARSLTFSRVIQVLVRDRTGSVVTQAEHLAYDELEPGTYSVEICADVKLYLRVEGAVTVVADTEQTELRFDGPREVLLGARSYHERPAATVTTSPDPEDVMAAVSTFGSALKTTTPERSYPTLRGHAPTVELGSELDVPPGVEPPDTGVELVVPPSCEYVFPAAPLAFYLGASVVPGDRPHLRTETGYEHDLSDDRFEEEVERVLKQTFFLDCVTRTEGLYPVPLQERRAVEDLVDLDFASLYDRPLAEQLEAYLSVPYSEVAFAVPDWRLLARVTPAPPSVELLPFAVTDLAVVHTRSGGPGRDATAQSAAIDDFLRSGGAGSAGDRTRDDSGAPSLEQVWTVDDRASGNTAPLVAFHNRLERDPADGDIDITVVCNDPSMDAEGDVVDDVYGSQTDLPFDVTVERELSVDRLREVLARETDFLHYVGHIDADGFECADGKLDARTAPSVGVDAFFLNACQSREQGTALVEGGSIGGVVTHSDIVNRSAVRVGRTMARLLNRGFPLRAALSLARGESVMGNHYGIVGDGGLAIAQPESGTPNTARVEERGDAYHLELETYPTRQRSIGSLYRPHVDGHEAYFLSGSDLMAFDLTAGQLARFLSLEDIPVRYDGELRWSRELGEELTDR